ncbi:MAG: AraC family transcriptional regulator [Paenibacillaceae bacterium]|jgi:AraC-like DNA-binding protein|nr:AraC family transcriptional regulator [Paenibacillaceae bacterium]
MEKQAALREAMDMPDPHFPIKVHRCRAKWPGQPIFRHHWHAHIEILVFMKGEASVTCGNVVMKAGAGDIIVVNSNELHSLIAQSEDLFYYALICDPSLLHSRSTDAVETKFITPLIQNRLLFCNKIGSDETLRACLLTLIGELDRRETGYELAVKSQLYGLLALLVRSHTATSLAAEEYLERMRRLKRFDPVFRRIEESYRESLTIEELARTAGLSRFHFSRLFKELTGKTVTDYVNAVRIDMSEQLLRSTPLTLSEIAELTGFNDIYYFSRMFKKYKNVPPSEWRRNV